MYETLRIITKVRVLIAVSRLFTKACTPKGTGQAMRRFPGPIPVVNHHHAVRDNGVGKLQADVFTSVKVMLLRSRRFCQRDKYWHGKYRRGTHLSISRLLSGFFSIILSRSLVLLATWYPGDETIRFTSEGPLRLMFSRSGLSIGNHHELHFTREIKLDAQEGSIKRTRKPSTVQGKIAERPMWSADLNVTMLAELSLEPAPPNGRGSACFFRVHSDIPQITLFDDGQVLIHKLQAPANIAQQTFPKIDQLRCTYFRLMTELSLVALHRKGETPTASLTKPDGSAGKILMMNSATTFDMLFEYHLTLLNHQVYAEYHHYAYILALVKPVELHGRSAKFAKHIAMGTQLAQTWIPARQSWDIVCHMDLDAWHASWAPFSSYADMWPSHKDLLLGDTGQIWLNSGLMCARPTRWALRFFDRVINAVFLYARNDGELGAGVGNHPDRDSAEDFVSLGFKRDQPAVWHVLSQTWADDAGVPYQGPGCIDWGSACNPDENPLECWHWCHWDALQRTGLQERASQSHSKTTRWKGLEDVNRLTHVHLAPPRGTESAVRNQGQGDNSPPALHRMCLRSCYSVLSRAAISLCSLLFGGSVCWPKDVDKMSLCDGKGCMMQMNDGGGGWIKHTGHQHWRDILPKCVPTSVSEALQVQRDFLSHCERRKNDQ